MSVTINAKGTSVSSFAVGKNGTTITQSGTISPPVASDLIVNLDVDQNLVVDAGVSGPALITATNSQDLHINPAVGGGQYLVINATRWPTTTGAAGQTLISNGAGVLSWEDAPGTGTVTSVSVTTANGISGSVATSTSTPAITLTLGAITPTSVASSGTVTGSNLTGSSSGTNTGDQTITLTGDVTGSGTGSFAATLATINASPQTDTFRKITVNGKGLVTATSAVTTSDITSLVDGTYVNVVGDTMTGDLVMSTTGRIRSSGIDFQLEAANGFNLLLNTGGAERVRVDSAGNVGIGKTPTVKLDVQGNANFYSGSAGTFSMANVGRTASEARIAVAASANDFLANTAAGDALFYQPNATNAWYGVAGAGNAYFVTNNAERMRINSVGNVGIAKSPSSRLDVGITDNGGITISNTADTHTGFLYFADTTAASGSLSYDHSNNSMRMWTNGSEKVRIDSAGNVGIGATGPTQKLEINGGLKISNSATLASAFPSGIFSFEDPILRAYVGDGTGYSWRFSKRSGSVTTDFITIADTGSMTSTGSITASTFNATSTARVKNAIVDMSKSYLDKFDLLKPREYDRTDCSAHEFGFIAEEMADIYPEVVGRDNNGDPSGIDYGKLSTILTAKVQEQQNVINELKSQMSAVLALLKMVV